MRKLLLGVLTGLSLGILFAPEKGKETRKKLANSNTKFADIITLFKQAGLDASEEVQDFIASDDIQTLLTKGKIGLDEVVRKSKKLSETGKTELALVFENVSKQILNNKEIISNHAKKLASGIKDSINKKSDSLTDKAKKFFS